VGLAGVGRWCKRLLGCLRTLDEMREDLVLTAVADVEPAAREHARDVGVPLVLASAEELFARPELDAVVIATPPGLHHEHARAALTSGKHVLVEKPLATRAAHARELVALAAATRRTLMVGHILLFNESVRWVKHFIDRGEAGPIRYAFFQRINTGRVRRSVDAMWNLAPHDLAIADFWFGDTPASVHAVGRSVLASGRDDASLIRLRYPCGGSACIVVSWLSGQHARRASIVTDRCVIECDELADEPVVVHRDGERVVIGIDSREPLRTELEHFVDCVRARNEPIAGGLGGLSVVSTLEAADRSKRERATVTLRWGDTAMGVRLR
jgi:predicted dehydrogenase